MFGKTNASTMLNGSLTKGVSITHENLSSSNPIINNNINVTTNERSGAETKFEHSEQSGATIEKTTEVNYDNPYATPNDELQSQNEFLKAMLNIYMNQKLFFSGKYIVCTPDELIHLIKLLTNTDTVEIETEAIEVSCLGNPKLPYSKIVNIWIIKDGQRSIFKYSYPQFLTLFDECKVSLKVIRVQ